LDPAAGTLKLLQTIPTAPEGEKTSPCDIQISPSGKFLYVSNRGGVDSIASYTIDASTGRLTSTGRAPTGAGPRTFALDPDGRFLVAASLGADFFKPLEQSVVNAFRIDQNTGKLTELGPFKGGKKPMWVVITKLRG
jgi:6-phosphogluconolactonase